MLNNELINLQGLIEKYVAASANDKFLSEPDLESIKYKIIRECECIQGSWNKTLKMGTSEASSINKMELKLTIAQLALLLRLLYEEGIFVVISIASLLRFFSLHFMSKRQKQISYGSMNKLYYSGDQFTGYAVRELLLNMVNRLNKMFFPI